MFRQVKHCSKNFTYVFTFLNFRVDGLIITEDSLEKEFSVCTRRPRRQVYEAALLRMCCRADAAKTVGYMLIENVKLCFSGKSHTGVPLFYHLKIQTSNMV